MHSKKQKYMTIVFKQVSDINEYMCYLSGDGVNFDRYLILWTILIPSITNFIVSMPFDVLYLPVMCHVTLTSISWSSDHVKFFWLGLVLVVRGWSMIFSIRLHFEMYMLLCHCQVTLTSISWSSDHIKFFWLGLVLSNCAWLVNDILFTA